MPLIDLQSNKYNTCVNRLRSLILCFSAQTREELLQFFPLEKEGLIDNSLLILERRGEIQQKEFNGNNYYYEKAYNVDFFEYWNVREKYISSLDFLRLMINSTDENGYLVNNIPWVGIGKKPCTLYFVANRKIFEIYDIPHEDIELITHMIQTKDKNDDYVTDPNNPRIVIIDNKSDMDRIQIKNVLYYAIYDKKKRSFNILKGSQL